MNKTLLVLIAVAAAAAIGSIGFISGQRGETIRQLERQIRAKEEQMQTTAKALAELKEKSETLASESKALREKLQAALAAEKAEAENGGTEGKTSSRTTAGKTEQGLRGWFGKMFDNPDMKKMIRAQQSMMIRPMYADFVKQRGLSQQETDYFFELVGTRQAELAELGMQAMKEGDAGKAGKEVEARKKELDADIENVLGKEGFAKFEEYEKTIGERTLLSQMRQQVTLTDDQANQLLSVMVEERQRTPQAPFSDPNNIKQNMADMMSDEKLEQYNQYQQELNKRVLERAGSILNGDQLTNLENWQKQMLEMQKFGMKMGREMFKDQGGKEGGAKATVTPAAR